MSGFVALVAPDERPFDSELIERLRAGLSARGPDGSGRWSAPGVALVQTKLAYVAGRAPLSIAGLVGPIKVVGDIRIDDRDALCTQLDIGLPADDAVLVQRAYERWGIDGPRHLIGDYAFALWDTRAQRLLVVRDRFGVRPLYVARSSDGALVFSNTLDVLRLVPGVDRTTLNDGAVADFLLFGHPRDPEATTYAGIGRLPPAHRWVWSAGAGRSDTRRYWELVLPEQLRCSTGEAVERLRAVLQSAVRDRLRATPASVLMSGGLDSTVVAALAAGVLPGGTAGGALTAHTLVYQRAARDHEGRYSRLAAQHLGLSHRVVAADDWTWLDRMGPGELASPEPDSLALAGAARPFHEECAAHGRLLLTGQGGDPVFYPSTAAVLRDALVARPGWAARHVLDHLRRHRRLPPLGVRNRFLHRRRLREGFAAPAWLEAGFAARLELPLRWQRWYAGTFLGPELPDRTRALASLNNPVWSRRFEALDAGWTGIPLQPVHPLFDVRVVLLGLRLASVPWCQEKRLLRQMAIDILPPALLRRPKSPLGRRPPHALARSPARILDELRPHESRLTPYLDLEGVCEALAGVDGIEVASFESRMDLRGAILAHWIAAHAAV